MISNMRGAIQSVRAAGPSSADIEQTVTTLASAAVTSASADASGPAAAALLAGVAAPAPAAGQLLGDHAADSRRGLKALVAPGQPRTST